MKVFLSTIVLLFTTLATFSLLAAKRPARQDEQAPATCESAQAELARFKDVTSEWGTNKGGDPWRSTKNTSTDGESFWEGFNIYKSKARFKKSVRKLNEDVEGVTSRTPLFDVKGRQIGQRVVKETRVEGKVTSVLIRRITDRMVQGISAPSLKLALTVEKGHYHLPGAG